MASTIVFDCPECGLPLAATQVTPKAGANDRDPGGHVHMEVRGTVTCVNTHEWVANGDFLLYRTNRSR